MYFFGKLNLKFEYKKLVEDLILKFKNYFQKCVNYFHRKNVYLFDCE
jgi:hypothetical protein